MGCFNPSITISSTDVLQDPSVIVTSWRHPRTRRLDPSAEMGFLSEGWRSPFAPSLIISDLEIAEMLAPVSGSIVTFVSLPLIDRLTLIRSSIATCAAAEPMVSTPVLVVRFAWTMFKELFLPSFLLC